jgi:hypothetical protein
MGLRFSVLITGTVLAVSSLSHATPPPYAASVKPIPSKTGPIKTNPHDSGPSKPAAPISVDGLAPITAILAYCSQVDRPDAGKYAQALASILSGHSSLEIKVDESNSFYGAGARSINLQLASLPITTVASACKNFLIGK